MDSNVSSKTIFNASRKDYLFHLLFYYLINVLSLFLLLPYTYVLKTRYVLSNTYIDNKPLSFNGSVKDAYMKFGLYFFLSIITLGIFYFFIKGKLVKWEIENTNFQGSLIARRSFFNYSISDYALILLNSFVIKVISLGFALPSANCLLFRIKFNNMYLNGEKMRFIGQENVYYQSYYKTYFLIVLSFGIYKFFRSYDDEKFLRENIVYDKGEPLCIKYSWLEKLSTKMLKHKKVFYFVYAVLYAMFIALIIALIIIFIV